MEILAHRGYWNNQIEQNSSLALRTALERGYGFESDIRDYKGKLVISHNIAEETSPDAEEIFKWLKEYDDRFCFAINVKADGLKEPLQKQLTEKNIRNYFLFDMSIPQMVEFQEMGLTYFTRQSEVEPKPVMYKTAAGLWVDGFWENDWINENLLKGHISAGKRVCLVSPELHSREHLPFWARISAFQIEWSQVMLCTDIPDEAAKFFESRLG